MFQELKYAVNIFACVITQLHVLHTALSVPQMITTYLQVDLFNLERYTKTQHTFEFIKHIYLSLQNPVINGMKNLSKWM